LASAPDNLCGSKATRRLVSHWKPLISLTAEAPRETDNQSPVACLFNGLARGLTLEDARLDT
jgi:hypothetical protein